jgi:glycerol-3-phosphate dehydrogenase
MKQADVIIVGGGIQGVSLALSAARRGLKPLIIERSALGAGATGASYGIVHGGLRYLQTLDIPRWRRSRQAQSWYLEEFPAHVRPLRCVMPLYSGTLRSPTFFKAGLALEDRLTRLFDSPSPLPPTYLLSADEVLQDFVVPSEGLAGGACWYDAEVSDMPGLLKAMLARAGLDETAVMAPYEATRLILYNERVSGLQITNPETGDSTILRSDVVVNCAGAWAGHWQNLARCPTAHTLAFNLILDAELPGYGALAVSATPGKGRSYFIRPHAKGVFAGTYYRPAPYRIDPVVETTDIQAFIDDLNLALPQFNLQPSSVKAVSAGLLPDKDGRGITLSSKEQVLSHKIQGFYSVIGGKFTTAPLLSEEAAERIWPALVNREQRTGALVKYHG